MEAPLLSEKFEAGGVSWRIMLYPRGNPGKNASGYVSMYLQSVDDPHKSLPDNWKKQANVTLTIEGAKKHDDENAAAVSARAVRRRYGNTFTKDEPGKGWTKFVSLTTLNDPDEGLVSRGDTVVITAEVCVILDKTQKSALVSCYDAAAHGNLDVLKYLRESMNIPWDVATCAAAAWIGNLEILKWARENGCPWDKRTCDNAARNGNLKLLKWARKNGSPWDDETCASALKGKHFDVVKYYVEERERALEVTDVIPGLLNEVFIEHVLKPDHLLTATDLARLRAVSPVMRDAVDATGRVLRSNKK